MERDQLELEKECVEEARGEEAAVPLQIYQIETVGSEGDMPKEG